MLQRLLNRFGYLHRSQIKRNWGGFPAAQSSRLTEDWPTQNLSIDAILRTQLRILTPRSRHLAMKDPYFQKWQQLLKDNVLGADGMALKNKALNPRSGELDKENNKIIEDAFYEWGSAENCTVSKELCWVEVQKLMLETIATDGEIIIRLIRGRQAQNKFNFAIQLVETDLLDIEKNEVKQGGGEIRLGVEKDSWGRRVAYWLRRSNPSDVFQPFGYDQRYLTLPAREVVHSFMPRRIGQTRGYPWAYASMARMNMLSGYEESEEVRARAASSKMLFFKRQPGTAYTGEPTDDGGKIMDFEPGLMEELDPGLEPMPIDWNSPSQNYDPFVKASLRGIAAGLVVSYPTLANDYAALSFSAGRMSQLEEREVWKGLQCWLAMKACNPIFAAWLEMSLISGVLHDAFGNALTPMLFESLNKPLWRGRRWVWVDPQKEVSAATDEINSGLSSWQRKLAEMGEDRDEVLAEIADDQDALATLPKPLPNLYQQPKTAIPANSAAAAVVGD